MNKMKQVYTVTLEVTTTNHPSGDMSQSEMNNHVKHAIKKNLITNFLPSEWQPKIKQVRKKSNRETN